MNATLVTTHVDGPVARVELSNPQRRNALSFAMMRELVGHLDAVDADPSVRVVIVSGAGPAFSAGHDLTEMRDHREAEFYDTLFEQCSTLMLRIHTLRPPVIARVHGVATAAGCQLVAACDLAIAADSARFATPGVNIGLFCSTPMVPITRAVGRKRAMEMLLTGAMIDAPTAADWGLVNRAVPEASLDDAVDDLAATIAAASGTVVALGKQAFWAQADLSEDDAYRRSAPVMRDNALLDDAHEGIGAFLEKRPPMWPGQ